MDPRELDLVTLALVRDEALAVYASRTSRWQGLQAGAVASVGLAFIGYFSNSFPGGFLLVLLGAMLLLLLLAAWTLGSYDKALAKELATLRAEIQRLKAGGGHVP